MWEAILVAGKDSNSEVAIGGSIRISNAMFESGLLVGTKKWVTEKCVQIFAGSL